jgi:hypothetical protein
MGDEIIEGGRTVGEAKAETFIADVKDGKDPKEAAKAVGMTLATLRKTGALARAARQLLERVEQEKLLDKKTFESIARARALELMLQDEDLKVSLGAVRVALGTGPQLAVQINNNLRTDPEVIESLKTLQLEVDGDATND